jgi:hypothetical protein
MFGDYLIFDSISEKYAHMIYKKIDKKLFLKPSVISIGGISGTRKSETAYKLAEFLINSGKQSHILSSDDYYKTPWHLRNDIRKKDISVVGPNEIDWNRLEWTLETFKNPLYNTIQFFILSKFNTSVIQCFIDKKNCDFIIFEGLYGCHSKIPSDFRVHLGNTSPSSTFNFRKKRKKENEEDEFRKKVVELECEAVKKLSENADLKVEV